MEVEFPLLHLQRLVSAGKRKVVARTHPYFTSLRMLKGSDVEPSKTTVPFKSSRKDLMLLRSLGGHPILGRILNRPSLLTG